MIDVSERDTKINFGIGPNARRARRNPTFSARSDLSLQIHTTWPASRGKGKEMMR
jgi:hypothetical protein